MILGCWLCWFWWLPNQGKGRMMGMGRKKEFTEFTESRATTSP
jgi:hypothetical protein